MRNSILKKRVFVAVASISMAFLILILNGNEILQAAQALIPTPLPVTPPPPGVTPIPDFSMEAPGQKVPQYFVRVPSFTGKILHWTQISYSYEKSSSSPTNGQPLTGQTWVLVSDDGFPSKFHNQYTSSNGTLDQESLQIGDSITVVMGANYPKPPTRCNPSPRRLSPDAARSLLPTFVDEGTLSRFGFTRSGGLTKQLPTTESLPGTKPLMVYGPDITARRWELVQSRNGMINIQALEIGAFGRVLVGQAQLLNAKGEVENETRFTFGALEVYDPASVPATVFTLSQKALEACHG